MPTHVSGKSQQYNSASTFLAVSLIPLSASDGRVEAGQTPYGVSRLSSSRLFSYTSHGMCTSQDLALDPTSRADPLEMIFAQLNVLQIHVHDLQAVVPQPKGPPSQVKVSS